MKNIISACLILATAIVLIVGSAKLKENPDLVAFAGKSLKGGCYPGDFRCSMVQPFVKEADSITYGIKRGAISRDELPILKVYMSDGAIGKLQSKRKSVLALTRPINISSKNDWVNGEALIEYEGRKEKSKVAMRLKGDWSDHIDYPRKLSLRIKTRSGGYLFGVKTFSVQHPVTRNYTKGPLVLEHMRTTGILTPRQKFIDMYVNDVPIGIMSMEEHFGKEMVEAQNRREGPILAIDEDPVWDQWMINYNLSPITPVQGLNFDGYRDGSIKEFDGSRLKRGTIPTQNRMRGESSLRSFFDGNKAASDVFDYDQLARHWIITNVWNGCHSMSWHNRRYYFNPISGLLEPVSFDNDANPFEYEFCTDKILEAALRDPEFIRVSRQNAKDIHAELNSHEFAKALSEKQMTYNKFFGLEAFNIPTGKNGMIEMIEPETLQSNLNSFIQKLETHLAEQPNESATFGTFKTIATDIIGEAFLENQANLSMHVRARYFPGNGNGNGTLEFRNMTLADVILNEVTVALKKRPPIELSFPETKLLSQKANLGAIEVPAIISDEDLKALKFITLQYTYNGVQHSREVDVQFKDFPTGFAGDPLSALEDIVGSDAINRAEREVSLLAREYNFRESISLPMGWRLTVPAGANLNFKSGALLKLSGPLFIKGTQNNPVSISVDSNLVFGSMGAWGGLLVSKSNERSEINHLQFNGTGSQNLNNRQDYYGMTGCINFFESDVDISNALFTDAQCEDALNIVRSDFTIDKMRIDRARSDAFDSDFSTGLIRNSEFIASGNDGVDVSGTHLKLIDIKMRQIGDKGISVGEKSFLEADGIQIDGAVIGLVSKDLSRVNARNIEFAKIKGTAIMSYIKKQEYGPSQIVCDECTFLGDMVQIGRQASTSIVLNGEEIISTKLTRRQMLDAGLIIEEINQ